MSNLEDKNTTEVEDKNTTESDDKIITDSEYKQIKKWSGLFYFTSLANAILLILHFVLKLTYELTNFNRIVKIVLSGTVCVLLIVVVILMFICLRKLSGLKKQLEQEDTESHS